MPRRPVLIGLLYGIALATVAPSLSTAHEAFVFSRPENGSLSKIAEKIIVAAYHRAGLHAFVSTVPAETSLSLSSQGITDGEVLRIRDIEADYPSLLRVDPVIFHLRSTAFVRKGSGISLDRPQDLAPYKIGFVKGVIHSQNMAAIGSASVAGNSIEELFQMLEDGTVDVSIVSLIGGQMISTQARFPNVSPAPQVLRTFATHHFLHEKHAKFVPQINTVLSDMKANGEITSLFLEQSALHFGVLH